ncbi:unnamed protein product, partial [Schistosoma mattheei]
MKILSLQVNSPISLNLALDNVKLNPKDSCSVGDNYVETRRSIDGEVVFREKEVEKIELDIRELQLRKRLLELTPNSLGKERKASEATEPSMSRSRDINPPVTSDRRHTNAHLGDEVQLKAQVDSIKSLFMRASLPKIEVMKFDGSPLKFWTFIKGFKTNIADRVDDDTPRLMYLIHYCEGTAKDAIEHCVLLPEEEDDPGLCLKHSPDVALLVDDDDDDDDVRSFIVAAAAVETEDSRVHQGLPSVR